VLDRRLKMLHADKGWRLGTIKAYHGGYLRHTGGSGCWVLCANLQQVCAAAWHDGM